MDIWDVLGIPPTEDLSEIKKAYAAQARRHHPEDDPEGFEALRAAYKQATAQARGGIALPPGAIIRGVEGPDGALRVEQVQAPGPEDQGESPPPQNSAQPVAVRQAQPAEMDAAPPMAPLGGRFAHGGGTRRAFDYEFEALDGAAAAWSRRMAELSAAFFRQADALYDDSLTRFDVGQWQALMAEAEQAALYGSADFAAQFTLYFAGRDLPDTVMREAVLPFARQWRTRWLGTPQWTLFNQLEDPAAEAREAEQARAYAFIAQMEALYNGKKSRGDVDAWRALFARPEFTQLQQEAFFNRMFARFIVNRPDIPKRVWDEVLRPLMDDWQAMWEGHPLWVSFAQALDSPHKRNPVLRFIDRRSGLVALALVAVIFAVLFLVQRGQAGKAASQAPSASAVQSFMQAQQASAVTLGDYLPLDYEDWAALGEEEARQRSVISTMGSRAGYDEVAEEAEALGLTREAYDALAATAADPDAPDGAIDAVKACHPVAAEIVREKVLPLVKQHITDAGADYWDAPWPCYALGLYAEDFDTLRQGYATHGEAWLDEQLAAYEGFALPVTMMQIPLPGLDGGDSSEE